MTDSMNTQEDENAGRARFAADMKVIQDDLERRCKRQLSDGQPIFAMEARLLARRIELREFTRGLEWAREYQNSIDEYELVPAAVVDSPTDQ